MEGLGELLLEEALTYARHLRSVAAGARAALPKFRASSVMTISLTVRRLDYIAMLYSGCLATLGMFYNGVALVC